MYLIRDVASRGSSTAKESTKEKEKEKTNREKKRNTHRGEKKNNLKTEVRDRRKVQGRRDNNTLRCTYTYTFESLQQEHLRRLGLPICLSVILSMDPFSTFLSLLSLSTIPPPLIETKISIEASLIESQAPADLYRKSTASTMICTYWMYAHRHTAVWALDTHVSCEDWCSLYVQSVIFWWGDQTRMH